MLVILVTHVTLVGCKAAESKKKEAGNRTDDDELNVYMLNIYDVCFLSLLYLHFHRNVEINRNHTIETIIVLINLIECWKILWENDTMLIKPNASNI